MFLCIIWASIAISVGDTTDTILYEVEIAGS